MDRSAFDRALRAAAQVSFVTMAGCATPPTPTTPPVASGTPPLATSRPVASTTASTGPDDCVAAGKVAFPAGPPKFWDRGTRISNPTLVACCSAIASDVDKFRGMGCCHVDGVTERMACTPWGPPVPPSMETWFA